MGFRDNLDECPGDHLWRIWNALKRHNKRHAAPRCSRETRAPRSSGSVVGQGSRSARVRSPRVAMPMPF
jgi:hypothetical protein